MMMIFLILMTGLMAGLYFTFSVVVMKSLSQLPPPQGAIAMNKINDVILNTAVMPIFFGSTLWCVGLVVWSIISWQDGSTPLQLSAALSYILGMFFVTAFGNVPLNNRLKQSENSEQTLMVAWDEYLRKWTRLNHVRTISCMCACTLLIMAQSSERFL